MEVMPSKFRSPPPKPPRRRHSDQLTVTSTGTYPSRKKNAEDSKLCIKSTQSNIETARCGSLPANWTNDYSPEQIAGNNLLLENALSKSKQSKSSFESYEQSNSSSLEKYSNGLVSETLESKNRHSINNELTKHHDMSHLGKFTQSFPKGRHYLDTDKKIVIELAEMPRTENKSHPIPLSQEHPRRHHSDPVLSFLNSPNSKDAFQKFALNSFLENFSCDGLHQCNSSVSSHEHRESQCLLEEMRNLKEINNKLWLQLCSTQAYVEKLEGNSNENVSTFSIAGLLSSLYSSQQSKDNAMEERINVILEQRDAAFQELDDMVQIIARNFKDDTIQEEKKFSGKEITNVLKEIEVTYNPAQLLQQQRLLLTFLYHAKELKQDQIVHELKLAITERNHLLEKVKYLEKELKSVKVCNEIWNSDSKNWENDLLSILCQVIHQRDVAFLRENAPHHFDHLIHRSADGSSLTVESSSNGFEFLQAHIDGNKQSGKTNSNITIEDSPLGEVKVLKGEIMVLSKTLEQESAKREQAEENCLRLERLVNVLQKKINGQNVGISV